MLGARRAITKPSKDASKYDLLAIGSPVWAGKPVPPVNYRDLKVAASGGQSVHGFEYSHSQRSFVTNPVNEYIDLLPGPGRAFVFVSSGRPKNQEALDALANRLKSKGFEIVGKFGMHEGKTFIEDDLKAALKKYI